MSCRPSLTRALVMGAGLAFAVPAVPAVAQTARDTGAVGTCQRH